MTFLIAFGTLKRGFALHERGLSTAHYLGPCRTVEPYPVVIAGPWFAPMMFDRPGTGLRIHGELYRVDRAIIVRLDGLESVEKPGNFRRLVAVQALGSRATCRAWCYMKSPELARPLHSGYIEDYQDDRFIPPEKREPHRA